MSLEVTGTGTAWSTTYDFLLMFYSNYGRISYRFRDKRRYLQNFAIPVHFRLRGWDSSWNFVRAVLELKNTLMPATSRMSKNWQLVHSFRHNTGIGHTDRQTDRQKCRNSIVLCMHCMLTRDKKLYIKNDNTENSSGWRLSVRDVFRQVNQVYGFYRATLCVSAVFAVAWCLSVRLSRWCIVSRRLKISSNFFLGPVAPSF